MPASVNPTMKATGLRVVAKPKAVVSSTSTSKGTSVKKKAPAQTRKVKVKGNRAVISDEQRHNYIEIAAYYIAERRGFQGGSELADWAQAEQEVDRLLQENRLSS